MLIIDPDCCTPDQAKIWTNEGFTIASVFDDRSLRAIVREKLDLVVPDFFPEIDYQYKVKPRVIGGSISISSQSEVPDFQDEGWQDLDDVLLAVRRERADQDKVEITKTQPESGVPVANSKAIDKGTPEPVPDGIIEDLPSAFAQMRDTALELE